MVVKDSKNILKDYRPKCKRRFDAEEEIFAGGGTNPPDYIIKGLQHCNPDARSRDEKEEREERKKLFREYAG